MKRKKSLKLYYEPDTKVVSDEFGDIVYNIYDYITPNMFYLWTQSREDREFIGLSGETIELIYLTDEHHLY